MAFWIFSRLVAWDAPGGDGGRPDPETDKVKLGQTLFPLPHNLQLGVGRGLTELIYPKCPGIVSVAGSSQRNHRPESRGLGLIQSYTALGAGPLEKPLEEHREQKQMAPQTMRAAPADKLAC